MLTVGELVETLGGKLLSGPAETSLSGLNSLADAGAGELSFFSNPKYLGALRQSRASAVLVPRGFEPPAELPPALALVAVDSPSLAFAQLLERFAPPAAVDVPGVAPTAVLGRGVRLGEGVSIQAYVVIEDGVEIGAGTFVGAGVFIGAGSTVGEGSRLYPHVTIRERTRLGRRVIVHSGTVIGSDGFGFETQAGRHVKIPQTGVVQIDDDVEIGANCTIDRARFGRTHIGEGTKIDNLVHIAHNVVVGPHCILVAQVGISGSTRLGKYVTMAGQVGTVGHIEIGDQAIVAAKAGVSKDVPAKAVVFGYPAQPLKDFKESQAHVRRLPKLVERVRKLEAELTALRAALPVFDNVPPAA